MLIESILQWYYSNKRDLPWRETNDPYKIWVSEVFLQQTQANRVIAFYTRFLERFPNVFVLASASWEDFLPYFQGLGFYSRGKNMLKTAQIIVEKYNGIFPNDASVLKKLPGIGDYTAAAIISFGYKQSVPAVDVNLFRVMGRLWNEQDQKIIRIKATQLYLKSEHGDMLNHAFMDIGSLFCLAKKTHCLECPLKQHCDWYNSGKQILVDLAPKKPMQRYNEYSVLVLRSEGSVFFEETNDILSFPCFYNEIKQDHRHFLQEQAMKKWNINLSVRPPFFTIIIDNNRYKFSRCQILQGENPKGVWKAPHKTIDSRFPSWYSEGFLKTFWKMKA